MTKHRDVLVKQINKQKFAKFAEIGVYEGSTTSFILRNCPGIKEYWAIDPWVKVNGKEWGWRFNHRPQETWDGMYHKMCSEMVLFPSLRVLRMENLQVAAMFPDGYFDFVYIDASHFYEPTLAEIRAWLPKVRKGGWLGGHDYGSHNQNHAGVTKAVDEVFGPWPNINVSRDMVWWKVV